MKRSLSALDEQLRTLERERIRDQTDVASRLEHLSASELRLQQETRNLVKALTAPTVRGQWGELQLQRVVELAGMLEHCDFETQADLGGRRPDLLVTLPGDRTLAVDAKTPLQAYLEAMETADPAEQRLRLKDHARQVRQHVETLAKRRYDELTEGPDLTVMFLPGEGSFAAALEHDPDLLEHAAANHVVLAGPTTLLALLRSVAHGWERARLTESAAAIQQEGRLLYGRIVKLTQHLEELRRGLDAAVAAYNRTVGSVQTRLTPSARRLSDMGAGTGATATPLREVEGRPRPTGSETGEG